MLSINEITSEIYHFKFLDQDMMALHLLRFSDYYEHKDDKLYRKKFSLSEAIDIGFKKNKDALGWADGINLPVSMMYKMAKEFGTSLTVKENFILSSLDTIRSSQPALRYIIATVGGPEDADEIFHELAHAFYYTNEAYKHKMDGLIRTLPTMVRKTMYEYLTHLDYNNSVHDDELQAYMATGLLGEEKEVLNETLINMFRAKFIDIFLEYLAVNKVKS